MKYSASNISVGKWSHKKFFLKSLIFSIPISTIRTPALMQKVFLWRVTWLDHFTFQSKVNFSTFSQLIARLGLETLSFLQFWKTTCFRTIIHVDREQSRVFFLNSCAHLANFCRWVASISDGTSMTLLFHQEVCGHLGVWVYKMLTDFCIWSVIHDLETKDNFSHRKRNETFLLSSTSV